MSTDTDDTSTVTPMMLAENVEGYGGPMKRNRIETARAAVEYARQIGGPFVLLFQGTECMVWSKDLAGEVATRIKESRMEEAHEESRAEFMEAARTFACNPDGPTAIGRLIDAAYELRRKNAHRDRRFNSVTDTES